MFVKIQNIRDVLKQILSIRIYQVTATVSAVIFLLLEIWLAHYSLLLFTFQNYVFTWRDKIQVLWVTIEMFFTIIPRSTQLLSILTALLIGLNIAGLHYYWKKQIGGKKIAGASLAGMAASILGVGCAACGSVVLSSLIGFAATTHILTILPLQGKEFSIFAIGILALSTYWILNKISAPGACEIKR